MLQLLKSELLWQLVGGFALGTIAVLAFGSSDTTHNLVHYVGTIVTRV
jgi:hypothetical protein